MATNERTKTTSPRTCTHNANNAIDAETIDPPISVVNELHIMRRRMRQMDKRLTSIEAHLESSEQTLARLRDFLDKQAIRDARETNRALRSRVPMPFHASHSSSGGVADEHSTQQFQSMSPLYAPLMMPSMAARFWPLRQQQPDTSIEQSEQSDE